MEYWKPIKEKPQYLISNKGRIKSTKRVIVKANGISQTINERIIKTFINKNGYEVAVIQDGEKGKHFQVHRLVSIAFIDNPKRKAFVNHIDGNKKNNCISNLEWCTKSENEKHAHRIGLKKWQGENSSRAILTDSKVLEIRKMLGAYSQRQIASMYGVSRSCIKGIHDRRTWKHI